MPNIYEGHDVSEEAGGGTDVERMELGGKNGILIYLKGHLYPIKGMPTPNAVQGINVMKKVLLEFSKHPTLLLTPRKTLQSFAEISNKALQGCFMQERYMTAVARELRGMIGTHFAHIIEYDSAYRLRLQDMFSSVSQAEMIERPIRSVWKMVKRNREQDYLSVHNKVRKIAWLLTFALLTGFRDKWIKAFQECTYENLCLDEGDVYWIGQRTDYGINNGNKIPNKL